MKKRLSFHCEKKKFLVLVYVALFLNLLVYLLAWKLSSKTGNENNGN